MVETSDADDPSEPNDRTDDADEDRLEDIDDGIGCVEIWNHLSEDRDEE